MSGRADSLPLTIADDFGLGRAHDRVILSLLTQGRVDGTSVMIDGCMDAADLARLTKLRAAGVQVGLHLNLTHPFANMTAHAPLAALLRFCLSGQVPDWARTEFIRQTNAFQTVFGSLPDYYDGHQHCHCLPGIAKFAAALPRDRDIWMRLPLPARLSGLVLNVRAGGIKVLLVAAFARMAKVVFERNGWRMNRDFSGFLRLDTPDAVYRWLPELLARASGDCLMMVHPGAMDDPVQCSGHAPRSRKAEATILSSRT